MQVTKIGYTFVGVWKTSMSTLPALDRQFVLDLFGDPYNTTQALTPDGIMITKPGSMGSASPNALFNNLKFQAGGPTIRDIKATVERFRAFYSKSGINLSFGQFGLNIEMELAELSDDLSSIWLGRKFLEASVDLNGIDSVAIGNLNFELKFADGNNLVVTMQPRITNDKALYMSVNDHRNLPFEVTDKTDFDELFLTTEKKIQQQLFTSLRLYDY